MRKKFESQGCVYDAEFFQNETSCIVRFYDRKQEQYNNPLSDLVVVEPDYGFLLIQYIGADAVLSGILKKEYFSKEMVEDIICFIEDNLPRCRNIYFPYHIDFVEVSDYEEYNGEY